MPTVSEIDAQIAQLEKERAQVIENEKALKMAAVETALQDLNALGYNYRIVDGAGTSTGGGRRRTGVRKDVLQAIKDQPGITRQQLLDKIGVAGDKSGENSVSNALSALKKAGEITGDKGTYEPA